MAGDLAAAGKTIRLVYASKDFTVGLTDVSLLLKKPDLSNYTPVPSIVEIGSGLYYADFAVPSIGPLGTWEAIFDSAASPAKAAKAFDVVSVDEQDIYAQALLIEGTSFATTTDSLHAIRAAVDALASQVTAIQNAVLEVVTIADQLLIPASSFTAYPFYLDVYNESGALTDADANPVLAVTDQTGTSQATNLYNDTPAQTTTMLRDSLGRYHLNYRVVSGTAELALSFVATYIRSGISRVRHFVTRTVKEIQASDLTTIQNMLTDIEGTSFVSATMSLAAVQALLVAVEGAGFVSSDSLHAIRTELTLMEGSSFATGTDSLRIIRGNLDTYMADIKGSGFSTARDSLREIRALVRGGLVL